MVSKGVFPFGKGYIVWPSIFGLSWVLLTWCYIRIYVEYSLAAFHSRHK